MDGHEDVEIQGSKAVVKGEKYPDFQLGMIRTIYGRIENLQYRSGFTGSLFGKEPLTASAYFAGTAIFEKDVFSIIKNEGCRTDRLPITIHLNKDEARSWDASVGYTEPSWEFAYHEPWFLQANVTAECFNSILQAYKTGWIESVDFSIDGTFWVRDLDEHTPPSGNVTWFLLPDKHGTPMLPTRLISLGWRYRPVAVPTKIATSDEPLMGDPLEIMPGPKREQTLANQSTSKSWHPIIWAIGGAILAVLLFRRY